MQYHYDVWDDVLSMQASDKMYCDGNIYVQLAGKTLAVLNKKSTFWNTTNSDL